MYQIPPLSNEYVFEEFICDLFNKIEKTNSFQTFGIKGQEQKGIDVYCGSKTVRKVIQCKKKDISKSDEYNRNAILGDFVNDLEKAKSLDFKFDSFILVSTYKNDAKLQEFVTSLSDEKEFNIEYWGWETIVNHLLDNPNLLAKYYPSFKLDAKTTLCSVKIWEMEGKIGVDYSELLSGIDGTVKLLLNDNETPKNIKEVLNSILDTVNIEYDKNYSMKSDLYKFDNFGFNTYLKAALEQAYDSFKYIEENIDVELDFNTFKLRVVQSLEVQLQELNTDDFILTFNILDHPAVKFVKQIFGQLFKDVGIHQELVDRAMKSFNDNIEKSIVNAFGQNNYEIHKLQIKEKWLKDNEINFLMKIKSLDRIGFSEEESLKYQEAYGEWKDVNDFKFNDEFHEKIRYLKSKDTNLKLQDTNLKLVEEMIEEYYEFLEADNKKKNIDHYFNSILFIIADFGKGKSSFVKHYAAKLATRYLQTGEGEFPVYFNLNEYGKYQYSSTLGIVSRYLETEYAIKLDDEYFKKKRYVFLIDSLDESGELTELHIKNVISDIKDIHNIERTINRKNKIIVTSRPIEHILRKYIKENRPFEKIDSANRNIPYYIAVDGFNKEQFNDYVCNALKKYWVTSPSDHRELTPLTKEIYESLINNNPIDIYDELVLKEILKPSELKRPIFAYMIYSLICNNVDFMSVGKIGMYISFLNQLTKDAKFKGDCKNKVKLKEEFKFRNILHLTSALWQYRRQTGEQTTLKKADICRVLSDQDNDKSDEDILKEYPEVEAIQFLSHSYLGQNQGTLHFQHQSFAEMLLAEYYLKVLIKYSLEQHINIEEARVQLLLGQPTDQTIEFLEGLLGLLKFCGQDKNTPEIIDKRRLLAPLLASLATSSYCKNLMCHSLYHKWFNEIEEFINNNEDIKEIPEEFLIKWPIKQKEINKITDFSKKILDDEGSYVLSKGEAIKVLFKNQVTKINNKVYKIPPDIDKWLALLAGNILYNDIHNRVFFNSKIENVGCLFEMMKNWNYFSDSAAPKWAKNLFMGIDMAKNKDEIVIKHLRLEELNFSFSKLENLTFKFSNLHQLRFKNSTLINFRADYCHLYLNRFEQTSLIGNSHFRDCIYVASNRYRKNRPSNCRQKFINFNLSTNEARHMTTNSVISITDTNYEGIVNEILGTFSSILKDLLMSNRITIEMIKKMFNFTSEEGYKYLDICLGKKFPEAYQKQFELGIEETAAGAEENIDK